MANRYWVTAGTGNWNSTTNWSTASGGASGASVPSTSDAAIFDASSGAGTATLDISPTVQTLTMTGFTGTLAFGTNTISLNSTGTVFTGATTMTVTGTPLIILTNNSATARTISPTAVTEANSISFNITAGTGGLTLTAGAYRNLDFTDGVNPTGYAGAVGNSAITIYGNFKASTGMTRTAGTGTYTFAATSGTKTINTAAVTFDNPFTFNGVGGNWQLQAALTSGSGRACALTNGTLDLNNFTFEIGSFASTSSTARTLAFGTTGNLNLTATTGTPFNGPASSQIGFVTTGNAQVNITGNGTTTRNINPGNELAITGFISFTISAGSDTISGTAGMTFNNLTFTSGFTGTFSNIARSIAGNLTLNTNTQLAAGTAILKFRGTGSQTITTSSRTLDFPLTFEAVGGTYAFQDALTQGSTRAFTITDGTVQLKAGVTSTVGSLTTSSTTQKFLQSTLAGTQATLSQVTGTVSVGYLTIKDINATGGATFNAYTVNSNVNAGNNLGWDFFAQLGKTIFTRRKEKRVLI